MKVRSGIDILNIERFEKVFQKQGDKFLKTFLNDEEIEQASDRIQTLAGFFSAKEAAAKAIGRGIWQNNISWHDFLIKRDQYGKPFLSLSGAALAYYNDLGGIDIDISISHEKKYVTAVCMMLLDK
ncbi:MAG TPA: holo-ACP synthase [Candidatus Eisenbacteria bacterium]|nr:holo-ACP synthase [Candidatus Eisenbacteria bacterium]